MDKYRIDSHKLLYHVNRVHDWLKGDITYPIYMEISPAGNCNHRCVYCGLDFMGYQSRYLDSVLLKERLSELGRLGLKSIMYAGEGEPFLHPDMADLINYTKKCGIDVAVATNGVLFDNEAADKVLCDMEWIKVSINGATADTYARIHRCKASDFSAVIDNMKYAAKLKKNKGYSCVLGMQLLLLPENHHEAVKLAEIGRDIGMDYLVVKPYSQHPQSKTTRYDSVKYGGYERLADELEKFNMDDFSVVFRMRTMKKWDEKRKDYHRCLALPFWSYIDAGGNVWGCSVYLRDERFHYGNIYDETFREIWEGQRRLRSLRWAEDGLETSKCRVNCRMDEVNRYLWELKNPPAHVNFI
ncbi:MAG: radical SAM protein [Candidatus Omnitrophota bacterium]|nr:radical SAM protein [Candidatus Omnitrophota bacterium]